MLRLTSSILAVLFAVSFSDFAFAHTPDQPKPAIDVVFCIDCSGSMGPVIEAAKQKVWTIVNQVAKAEPSPVLRIGFIGYGNADQQYRTFALSDDLDEVYKFLSTLRDEGWSAEFVGRAIFKASNEMKWADGDRTLKVIYVIGNETAHQGPAEFDYVRTAPAAIAMGIHVNAIYCGDTDYQAATPTWREVAQLASGRYAEIARDGGIVAIATPFDDKLAALNAKLNGTYCAYGERAEAGAANQLAQDNASAALNSSTAADRAVAKSSKQYVNGGWDLVDALKEKKVELSKLKDEQLPADMKKMSLAGRAAYVEQKGKERAAVQEEIKILASERAEYMKKEMAKHSKANSLDKAITDTITLQATEKGFTFEK